MIREGKKLKCSQVAEPKASNKVADSKSVGTKSSKSTGPTEGEDEPWESEAVDDAKEYKK